MSCSSVHSHNRLGPGTPRLNFADLIALMAADDAADVAKFCCDSTCPRVEKELKSIGVP